MNDLPEKVEKNGKMHTNPMSVLCGLTDYTVKSDYDVTVQLYPDKKSTTPECSHHLKGSMKHELGKLLAFGGLMIGLAAICAAAVCICKNLMCD